MIDQHLFDSKELTLKKFLPQLTSNRLLVSSIFFGLFVISTFIGVIFTMRYNLDYYEVTHNLGGLQRLISGGTIRSLAIEGGQWWRIFSYGFAMTGYGLIINLFVAIMLGNIFWRTLKFNEGISGSFRTLGAFVGSYILCGFTLSVLGGPYAYGGIFVMTAIVAGMIVGTINSHKNQVFDFINSKLIWTICLFIFLPLFTSPGDWIGTAFGFVIGMAFMNLIHFRSHHSSISTIFSVMAIGLIFLLGLIFALIPLPYGLAKDPVVIQMLYVQSEYNLALTRASAEAILERLNWGKFEITEKTLAYLIPMFKF